MPPIYIRKRDGDRYHGYFSKSVNVSAAVLYPILALYLIYTGVTFAMFMYRLVRLKDKTLSVHSARLISLQTAFGVLYSVNGILHGALPNYPCFVDMWCVYLGYTIWEVVLILHVMRFYYNAQHSIAISEENRHNPVTPDNLIEYLKTLQLMSSQQFPQSLQGIPDAGGTESHRPIVSEVAPFLGQLDTTCDQTTPPALPEAQRWQNYRRKSVPNSTVSRKLSRWAFSNRFYGITITATFLLTSILVLFMNIFSRRMSLHPVYYNCSIEWEHYPITGITAFFNVILWPFVVFKIWAFRDVYGMRNAILFSAFIGIASLAASIAWTATGPESIKQFSTALLYFGQIVFVYTCFVTYPLINSIRHAKREKRGKLDTLNTRQNAAVGVTKGDLASKTSRSYSKQAFFAAMQNAKEHWVINHYASKCLCSELISFLDAILAFKQSIYRDLQSHWPATIPSLQNICSDSTVKSAPLSIKSICSRSFVSLAGSLELSQANMSTSQLLPKPTRPLSTKRPSIFSKQPHSQLPEPGNGDAFTANNLASLAVGITETMSRAFPDQGINSFTAVSENLREHLTAIINTFVLPEAPLAINIPSSMVNATRAYLAGGQLTFGMIDRVKDHVVDLLYSNVYIRYCSQ